MHLLKQSCDYGEEAYLRQPVSNIICIFNCNLISFEQFRDISSDKVEAEGMIRSLNRFEACELLSKSLCVSIEAELQH